jgi:hypothetical protein
MQLSSVLDKSTKNKPYLTIPISVRKNYKEEENVIWRSTRTLRSISDGVTRGGQTGRNVLGA